MSQAISAVPSTYTGQIIQYAQDFLANPLVPRVVNAVAIPFSILATFGLQPYLILDPSTTLIGIGCAILVNTVFLKYLHSFIQDYWVNYWATNYVIPSDNPVQVPSAATRATPLPPAIETPLAAAKAAYKASLAALDIAILRVKRAHIELESVDQGQETYILRLRLAVYEKKAALIDYAGKIRVFIEELIQHQRVLEPYALDIQEIQRALPAETEDKDSPQALKDAVKILNIDLTQFCERLNTIFSETREQLSATEGPSYIDQQNRLSTDVLRDDEGKLAKAVSKLQENQTKEAKIVAKELEQTQSRDTKRKELGSLTLSFEATSDEKAISEIQKAQKAVEDAKQKLADKKPEKLRRLEEIRRLENYGVPRVGEFAGEHQDDELFKFESEVGLMSLRKEYKSIIDTNNDDAEIVRIVAKLNQDLALFRTQLYKVGHDRIKALKTWAKKFGELSEHVAKKPASLQHNAAVELVIEVTRPITKKRELTAHEKVKYTSYYTMLAQVYAALVIYASKPLSNYLQLQDEDKHLASVPKIDPLDIKGTEVEHSQALTDYKLLAEGKINAEASLILAIEEVLAAIQEDKLKGTIEKSDIALIISKQAILLRAIPHDVYTLAIRSAQDQIFKLRETRSRAEILLPQVEKEFKVRQAKIEELKESLAQFEKREIDPLKSQLATATDGLVSIEVKIANLGEEIKKIDAVLLQLEMDKRGAAFDVSRFRKEQVKLANRIDLARKAISLAPIMDPVGKISKMRGHENVSIRIINDAYRHAEKMRSDAEAARPAETESAQRKLNLAQAEKAEKVEAERQAFTALAIEQAKAFDQEVIALRGSRHQSIVAHSETVQNLYNPKIGRLTGTATTTNAGSSTVQRSHLQTSSLEIIEKKIEIAAAKIKMNAFSFANNILQGSPIALEVDQARLRLAEHRLKRHRLEEKWRTSQEGEAINTGDALIEMIKAEKLLTFHYFALKLSRDAKKETNHAVKANFAILNLILDIIHVKSSNLDLDNRRNFNVITEIKYLFKETMETEAAIQFNEWAYGKPQQPVRGYSWSGAVKAALGRGGQDDKQVTKNLFVEKLIAALDLDEKRMDPAASVSSLKLTNFLEEVDNRSRQFHAERERVVSAKTHIAVLIGSKIALTQLSLTQPLANEERFKGKFTELYQPAKRKYQRNKYVAKVNYATAMKMIAAEKAPYKDAKALKETEVARQREAERARDAAALAAIERAQFRADAQAARDRAIQTYSGMEKLSYLIPVAALWALYQFSPLLTLISLSARVSQNILFIGSATHLFAESFFRGPPPAETNRPLSADRVTAA